MWAYLGMIDKLEPCVNEVNEINYVPLGFSKSPKESH